MILCVDPDSTARTATREALADAGFTTRGCASMDAATDVLREDHVDCLVTEQTLPDGTGLELLERARDVAPDAVCVLYTDRPLDDVDTSAFGDLVAEYLRKGTPNADAELVALVEHGVAFRSQTAYPLPQNEEARVAALDRYAADPAALGDSLSRLTRIATERFDVDSAAVGLIDATHERFLSCHGASFGRLNREDTICTYAILDEGVTVVEDVPADPRFSENTGLAAAGIAFYAGAPLLTPDGHAIGVFCVHDGDPRSFSDDDRESLRLFADEAMERLELHRRLQAASEAAAEARDVSAAEQAGDSTGGDAGD